MPYITAPPDLPPEQIVAFVEHWIDDIRELRADMIKRYEKSKSLKCHYQTGDVAYLFGRPFMLRVFPIAKRTNLKVSARGRANVNATMRPEVSVIDLFLIQANSYDQGKTAFLTLAKPIFLRNAESLVTQVMARAFTDVAVPRQVRVRPLRTDWVSIDMDKSTVWFSEALVPYPPDCLVYAFLQAMAKVAYPAASEAERTALLDLGLPNWQAVRDMLADPNSPYANQ